MTDSRSIHISTNHPILFLVMAEQYSTEHMYHIFFIHSSVNGHLGCFHILAIVNSATVNTGVHVPGMERDGRTALASESYRLDDQLLITWNWTLQMMIGEPLQLHWHNRLKPGLSWSNQRMNRGVEERWTPGFQACKQGKAWN